MTEIDPTLPLSQRRAIARADAEGRAAERIAELGLDPEVGRQKLQAKQLAAATAKRAGKKGGRR